MTIPEINGKRLDEILMDEYGTLSDRDFRSLAKNLTILRTSLSMVYDQKQIDRVLEEEWAAAFEKAMKRLHIEPEE